MQQKIPPRVTGRLYKTMVAPMRVEAVAVTGSANGDDRNGNEEALPGSDQKG